MFDYLIVGAGFAGSVLAERLASQANKKVLIIDRLVQFFIEGLELELEGAVRELAVDEVKILIHRSGKDQLAVRNHVNHFLIVGVEHDLNIGVIQHLFKQACIPLLRHDLIDIAEVAVVAVIADRDA